MIDTAECLSACGVVEPMPAAATAGAKIARAPRRPPDRPAVLWREHEAVVAGRMGLQVRGDLVGDERWHRVRRDDGRFRRPCRVDLPAGARPRLRRVELQVLRDRALDERPPRLGVRC